LQKHLKKMHFASRFKLVRHAHQTHTVLIDLPLVSPSPPHGNLCQHDDFGLSPFLLEFHPVLTFNPITPAVGGSHASAMQAMGLGERKKLWQGHYWNGGSNWPGQHITTPRNSQGRVICLSDNWNATFTITWDARPKIG
jgi:hypothetical protein